MQIQNISSSFDLNYDISLKKENKVEENLQVKISDTDEFSLDIKKNISSSISLSLSTKEIDEKINSLNTIKSIINNSKNNDLFSPNTTANITIEKQVDFTVFNFDDILNNIPNSIIQEEVSRARDFLNPNQKFFSQADKDSYLSKMESMDINIMLLPEEERKIFFENTNKAISNDFDKRNDFDSAIDSVYFAKKDLQKSNSLNNKSEIDNKLDILDEINEKLLLASKSSTSLSEKESLVAEIKDLSKNFDEDFQKKLSKNLDDVIDKNKEELEELSSTDIKVSSFEEAKIYLEKIEKLDINFDTLSYDEKKNYLENKQKVIDALKSQESISSLSKDLESKNNEGKKELSFSEINDNLNSSINKILQREKDELEELTDPINTITSLDEAKDFLEKTQRRKNSINKMSEFDRSVNDSNVQLAKQFIENDKNKTINNEIDTFIGNIDNLIDVLNKAKSSEKDFDYKTQNITSYNGSFSISQSTNIDANNVYRLIS